MANYGNENGTTACEYNALTGALVNASFLTGLDALLFITAQVPEPGTRAVLDVGASLLGLTLRSCASCA